MSISTALVAISGGAGVFASTFSTGSRALRGGDEALELAARGLRLAGEERAEELGRARADAALAARERRRGAEELRELLRGLAARRPRVALERRQAKEQIVERRGRACDGGERRERFPVPRDGGHVRARVALQESRRPATSSHNITPSAYTSTFASPESPLATSGAT